MLIHELGMRMYTFLIDLVSLVYWTGPNVLHLAITRGMAQWALFSP
jgi:hypothetical protein